MKNADRMMTSANPVAEGVEVTFADGRRGLIPFTAVPEIGGLADLAGFELPNPYELVLRDCRGETMELAWDFARHHCDPAYRPGVEAVAAAGREAIGPRTRRLRESAGREAIGPRTRRLRESAGMTQDELAGAAGIGRVTLVRIERRERSPRYETLSPSPPRSEGRWRSCWPAGQS